MLIPKKSYLCEQMFYVLSLHPCLVVKHQIPEDVNLLIHVPVDSGLVSVNIYQMFGFITRVDKAIWPP